MITILCLIFYGSANWLEVAPPLMIFVGGVIDGLAWGYGMGKRSKKPKPDWNYLREESLWPPT